MRLSLLCFYSYHNFCLTRSNITLGKEMVVDSTFEFEKKRDEPLVYNRNLVVKTIQAMKRIAKIKERREMAFFKERFYTPNVFSY